MEEAKVYILQEAEKLFMKYGLRSVTMDDVAKHLGMSKKTLYVNFKDKNDLVNNLIIRMLSEDKCCLESNTESSANAIDEVFKVMVFFKENLSGINPVVFYDLAKYHPDANNLMNDFHGNYVLNKCIGNLRRGIAEGLFREDINVEIIASNRVKQIKQAFESDLVQTGKHSLYDVILELTFHFLYGIATLKGQELIKEYKETINNI